MLHDALQSHVTRHTAHAGVLIEDSGSNGDEEGAGPLIAAYPKSVLPSVKGYWLSGGFVAVSDNAGSMSQSSGKVESGGGGGGGGGGGVVGIGGGGVGGRGRELSSPPIPPNALWDNLSDDDEFMGLNDDKAVDDLPMISAGSDGEQNILLK